MANEKIHFKQGSLSDIIAVDSSGNPNIPITPGTVYFATNANSADNTIIDISNGGLGVDSNPVVDREHGLIFFDVQPLDASADPVRILMNSYAIFDKYGDKIVDYIYDCEISVDSNDKNNVNLIIYTGEDCVQKSIGKQIEPSSNHIITIPLATINNAGLLAKEDFIKLSKVSYVNQDFNFDVNIIPNTDNTYSLGSSDKKWKELNTKKVNTEEVVATSKVKIGLTDSYGSTTKPIYWNNGVPTAITSYEGNAASADKLNTNAGSSTKPIYFSNGKPVASSSTIGGAKKPVYLDSGTITAFSQTEGSSTKPVYLNSGAITEVSGPLDISLIPAAALERLIVVTNAVARKALTDSDIQLGDVVKETDTELMYYVKGGPSANNKFDDDSYFEIFTTGGAAKATADGAGNTITSTYIKDLSLGEDKQTITYVKGDGETSGSFVVEDKKVKIENKNNTTIAYLTGSTSLSGDGNTLVTDSNVYLDTKQGALTIGQRSGDVGMCSLVIDATSTTPGFKGKAVGAGAFSQGRKNFALGYASHAEGFNTIAEMEYSHAEGYCSEAKGNSSHAEGCVTAAKGTCSHAEGISTIAEGDFSHAEGDGSEAKGSQSHAEGNGTLAYGDWSHAEGLSNSHLFFNKAYIRYNSSENTFELYDSRSDGELVTQNGYYCIKDKTNNSDSGYESYIGKIYSYTEESYRLVTLEELSDNSYNAAIGIASHTEGEYNIAYGRGSHAEGRRTLTKGICSHAEGVNTIAEGDFSHSGGSNTIASEDYQTVIGKFNNNSSDSLFIVGNGTSNSNRSNAFSVSNDGTVKINEKNIFDLIYPVGSIYTSVNDTNPSILFGGTWERIRDTFLLAAGNTYAAGASGGEAAHTLTVKEMPQHNHGADCSTIGDHGHTSTLSKKTTGNGNTTALHDYYYANASGGTKLETNITGNHAHTITIGASGENNAHNNMPPYLAVYVWKRTN